MDNLFKIAQDDIYLFRKGDHFRCYNMLGAHLRTIDGKKGCLFRVWAPFVKSVRVVGCFNNWSCDSHFMEHADGGIWQIFIDKVKKGDVYKYVIETLQGELIFKADPYAFYAQLRPDTASVVWPIEQFKWSDKRWRNNRAKSDHFSQPMNIYEVHLGSWRHKLPDGPKEQTPQEYFYSYRELAEILVPYLGEMGYTHVELMPIMEHPYDGSWGYQLTGYYAPTARYGTPDDLKHFINTCHKAGIGVIFDWVPGHFCPDAHGLSNFNGTALYELSRHPEWGTYKFDFGRGEVRSFLLSNATYWLEHFHIDGIRVDGVTSMLYLNYGIENESDKRKNSDGGEEDLQAIRFLKDLNSYVAQSFPGIFTAAEESTAFPLITYPPDKGGLGFHYKWDMGWMNDTLEYMSLDFPYRPYHHNLLTFSMMYAFNENFIVALSHDEVVHGKKSLLDRMSGDYWRQFANLRLLHLYQTTHTGAKLSFMGSELGQYIEWRYYQGVEWFLLDYEAHGKHHDFVRTANNMLLKQKALWEQNYSPDGFSWLEPDNNEQGILIYKRQGKNPQDYLLVLLNFHPHTYSEYKIGVPELCDYCEIINSDSEQFGGSGKINSQVLSAQQGAMHGQPYHISLTVPPLGGTIIAPISKR